MTDVHKPPYKVLLETMLTFLVIQSNKYTLNLGRGEAGFIRPAWLHPAAEPHWQWADVPTGKAQAPGWGAGPCGLVGNRDDGEYAQRGGGRWDSGSERVEGTFRQSEEDTKG